jgi:hypothetical protein
MKENEPRPVKELARNSPSPPDPSRIRERWAKENLDDNATDYVRL